MIFPRSLGTAALLGIAALTPASAQFGLDKLIPKPPIPVPVPAPKPPAPKEAPAAPADPIADIVRGAKGVSLSDELAIGGTVALEIVAKNGGILRDEALTRRVALIGKALASHSTRPELPWRFGVLDSSAVNGFSAPGGYVFVTRELVEISSDDELAGVLAHEISHVTRRHALRIVSRGQLVKGLAAVGAMAAAEAGGPDLTAYDSGISKVTETLLDKGYDPGIEYDADRAGRNLAYETGYDPDGLTRFLQKLQTKNPSKSYAFSTHPPLKHRLDRLEKSGD